MRTHDLVELIMSLEEEFSKEGKSVEVSDEDAEKIAPCRMLSPTSRNTVSPMMTPDRTPA
jgi:hypothetical protein